MKGILIFSLLILSFSSFGYDDNSIKGEIDVEGFVAGSDTGLAGRFFYIVDRTNKLCYAGTGAVGQSGGGGGLQIVDCKKLHATKSIKKFIDTGKID